MKRVRCPKCDKFLSFDETRYSEGQSLVFVCDDCGKQFSIRIGKNKLNETPKNDNPNEQDEMGEFGCVTVLENVFGYKQIFPLSEGDNYIGRRCVGTVIQIPIESGDMSLDRRHCNINVKRNKQGEIIYSLSDGPSLTGTFLMNEILGPKERVNIEDGAIITLGATTLILRTKSE